MTIQDNDELPAPGTIATLNAPMAIDYHPGNSSLIVSYNWLDGVSPHRLPCIFKGPFTAG